jgi:hypothetical protein
LYALEKINWARFPFNSPLFKLITTMLLNGNFFSSSSYLKSYAIGGSAVPNEISTKPAKLGSGHKQSPTVMVGEKQQYLVIIGLYLCPRATSFGSNNG